MISVDEALARVLKAAEPRLAEEHRAAAALGLVLAEDLASDLDSPPWDKSLVDGYAVIAADLADGQAVLEIIDEVMAGQVPCQPLGRGQTTRVMTGAPLPVGADAVVMVERTTVRPGGPTRLGRVEIRDSPLAPGRNCLARAASMQRGQMVLAAGCRLGPAQLGLAAEVGRTRLRVVPRPVVAVLSTGNELVPAEQFPGPGQIRNSNGPMLLAQAQAAGCRAMDLGMARDEAGDLAQRIARGLEADLVVLSGGVSAGVLDLVPGVLAELGVGEIFHQVRLKPGKPIWFGCRPDARGGRLVFGLPGNPVSSFVCWELFVAPALRRMAGIAAELARPGWIEAELTREFAHRGDRPTYHPARLAGGGGHWTVEPLAWQGSADLKGLAQAGALVHFPAGDRAYATGDRLEVLSLGLEPGPPAA